MGVNYKKALRVFRELGLGVRRIGCRLC